MEEKKEEEEEERDEQYINQLLLSHRNTECTKSYSVN